jgi:hypothetical protein
MGSPGHIPSVEEAKERLAYLNDHEHNRIRQFYKTGAFSEIRYLTNFDAIPNTM